MRVDIYMVNQNISKFIAVYEGTKISTIKFPEHIGVDLSSLSLFKKGLNISQDDKRIALDANDVIRQIADSGFAIFGAKIETSPKV